MRDTLKSTVRSPAFYVAQKFKELSAVLPWVGCASQEIKETLKARLHDATKNTVRRATKSRCVDGLIRVYLYNGLIRIYLSKSFNFLATACNSRTKKPVSLARFCRMSHVFVASCKRALLSLEICQNNEI